MIYATFFYWGCGLQLQKHGKGNVLIFPLSKTVEKELCLM